MIAHRFSSSACFFPSRLNRLPLPLPPLPWRCSWQQQQQASTSPACEHLLAAARAAAAASASHMAATAGNRASAAAMIPHPTTDAAARQVGSSSGRPSAAAGAGAGAGATGASAGAWRPFSLASKPLVSIGLPQTQGEPVSSSPAQAAAEAALRAAVEGGGAGGGEEGSQAAAAAAAGGRPLSCTDAESVQRMGECGAQSRAPQVRVMLRITRLDLQRAVSIVHSALCCNACLMVMPAMLVRCGSW